MQTSRELRNKLEQWKGLRDGFEKESIRNSKQLKEAIEKLTAHEQAKEVIKEVSLQTQQQLQYHISDVVSVALEAVFPNPYEFCVEFVERRNSTECDLTFVRDENHYSPMLSSGGGAVDVAAFALRISSWCLQNPRTRRTIILDEPMRFVSVEYREKVSAMIKDVSQRLGLQFIIITHDPTLATYADRTFEVSNVKGVSKVRQYT